MPTSTVALFLTFYYKTHIIPIKKASDKMSSKQITVQDILNVTGGELVFSPKPPETIICENVSRDTRTVKKGDTYIGIKGANFNGNEFWHQAVDVEASIVIVEGIDFTGIEKSRFKDTAIVLVQDTIKALGQIAKYKRSLYNIPVIAITGSVGKTSTKDIIANVVSQKYKTLKTEGNLNNHIGLPITLLNLKDHEAVVVEMGMNHFGEISYLTNIANPTLSVITNIGTSHIGNLGSRENILKAKLEILEGMENKKLILNNDNDLLHKFFIEENKNISGNPEIKFTTFGIENLSDVTAENIELHENSSTITIENQQITVPVGGIHFVYNALCAAAVASSLGITAEQLKHGIESFELTQKRMEIIELKNGAKLINDSYNASYESMQASLKYLSALKSERKIAVLGDMLELGDFSKELHQNVGNDVVKNQIDLLVCIGKEASNIANGAVQAGMNKKLVIHFNTNQEALEYLKNTIQSGDTILLKASNGMKLFELAEQLKNNI